MRLKSRACCPSWPRLPATSASLPLANSVSLRVIVIFSPVGLSRVGLTTPVGVVVSLFRSFVGPTVTVTPLSMLKLFSHRSVGIQSGGLVQVPDLAGRVPDGDDQDLAPPLVQSGRQNRHQKPPVFPRHH